MRLVRRRHVYDREYGRSWPITTEPLAGPDARDGRAGARKDVYGYDAFAWAHHAAGDDADALTNHGTRAAARTTRLPACRADRAGQRPDRRGQGASATGVALNPTVSPLVVQQAQQALAQ